MSVHVPMDIQDALTMLDSRIPLTASERKMIVEGLYNLAFEAGVRSEQYRLRQMAADAREGGSRDFAAHLDQAVGSDVKMVVTEYEDTTARIRRKLEDKSAAIRELKGKGYVRD